MKKKTYSALPIYQKSLALQDLSHAIAQYFTHDRDRLKLGRTAGLRSVIAFSIATDASLIPQNIERGIQKNGRIKNRSARVINTVVKNILSYCNGLEHDGIKEREYLDLLRKEIRIFRNSFKQWHAHTD